MSGPAAHRAAGAIALVAALPVLAFLGPGGCSDESGTPSAQEAPAADPAPDFTLERLGGGGEPVTLSSLRGKTVVIDFWATWCPPCEFQVPELNAVYRAHREAGDVEVLGVSIDTEGPEVVEAWTEEKGVEYPILLGDERLARRFGAMGFPTLAVVDPDGNIASLHVGLIERDELEEDLEAVKERFADRTPAEPAASGAAEAEPAEPI